MSIAFLRPTGETDGVDNIHFVAAYIPGATEFLSEGRKQQKKWKSELWERFGALTDDEEALASLNSENIACANFECCLDGLSNTLQDVAKLQEKFSSFFEDKFIRDIKVDVRLIYHYVTQYNLEKYN
jgi:hypothetical protein